MISNSDLCLDAEKQQVVLEGTPEARYVLVGKGCFLHDAEAEKHGLLGGPYDASAYAVPPTELPNSSDEESENGGEEASGSEEVEESDDSEPSKEENSDNTEEVNEDHPLCGAKKADGGLCVFRVAKAGDHCHHHGGPRGY